MTQSQSVPRSVVVLGASGFVGSAVTKALRDGGLTPVPLTAPRLNVRRADQAHELADSDLVALKALRDAVRGADAVVNCAGLADASSVDELALTAANATLPLLIGTAAHEAGCPRFVHVSSAVVQGRKAVLDDTTVYDPFSPYAQSKIGGEVGALRFAGATVYRPPGVHGPDRDVTRALISLAQSPVRSVAAPGTDPSPQALIGNVGSAVAFLASCAPVPPRIVIHPWEGMTTTSLLSALGHHPHQLPRPLARGIVTVARLASGTMPALTPHARRLEMLWFGQRQAHSWLEQSGWNPPFGPEQWPELARAQGQVTP